MTAGLMYRPYRCKAPLVTHLLELHEGVFHAAAEANLILVSKERGGKKQSEIAQASQMLQVVLLAPKKALAYRLSAFTISSHLLQKV